jgi:TonB family protein
MTARSRGLPRPFKRALIFSAVFHTALIILLVASPSMSRTATPGLVQYVNFIGPGGEPGGGTGGAAVVSEPPAQALPPPAKRETLRDLTVPEKLESEDTSTMRYPVEKPARAKKTPPKKAAISKPEPAKTAPEEKATSGQESGKPGSRGPGFGLRFGTGGPGGGTGAGGLGGGSGDAFGISGFPFTYYLQLLSDRISSNWFSSLVDPGVGGQLQTQVGFKIYRNGQVADLKVEASSGIEAFDLSAERAIQSASPFPPLPAEYDGQYLVIHLIFEHSK